jgi:hypothetical protein
MKKALKFDEDLGDNLCLSSVTVAIQILITISL